MLRAPVIVLEEHEIARYHRMISTVQKLKGVTSYVVSWKWSWLQKFTNSKGTACVKWRTQTRFLYTSRPCLIKNINVKQRHFEEKHVGYKKKNHKSYILFNLYICKSEMFQNHLYSKK